MNYEFPKIEHIQDLLDAIEGRDEFVVKHDEAGGYKVINYLVNYEDTFPVVKGRKEALIRECRGITFCAVTGVVLARKYHKFFNLNERPETRAEVIDFTEEHDILEKLDGSMLTPLVINGVVRWTTKMGLTSVAEPVDHFTSDKKNYHDLVLDLWSNGQTPIFEWCSRIQRIVIDYPVDRLVLTAVRENVSGEYLSYDQMVQIGNKYGVEVVRALPGSVENLEKFMAEAYDLEGEEGYIVRFKSGHMVKVKGAWYSQLHKTLDHLRFEKDVIRLIIDEKIDDAKAFLPVDLVSAVDQFAQQIFTTVSALSSDIYWEAQAAYDNLNASKKRFALEVVNDHPKGKVYGSFLFKAWDKLSEGEEGVRQDLLQYIGHNLATQNKVDAMRFLLGPKSWYALHRGVDLDA